MPTITWQFSTPAKQDFISKQICWKNDSEISHVDVITQSGQLLGAHIEDGVQVRAADYEEFGLRIRVTLPVTTEQYHKFWEYLDKRVGDKYNVAGIIGIALGDNITATGVEFCSEVQTDAIKFASICWIAKASCKIDPETLRLILTSQPGASELRIVGNKAVNGGI